MAASVFAGDDVDVDDPARVLVHCVRVRGGDATTTTTTVLGHDGKPAIDGDHGKPNIDGVTEQRDRHLHVDVQKVTKNANTSHSAMIPARSPVVDLDLMEARAGRHLLDAQRRQLLVYQ